MAGVTMLAKPLHIVLIAGEPSGDALGASLMRALKTDPGIVISGVGGAKMEAEGLQSLFPIHDLAVMGIVEVLPNVKKILGLIEQTADYIEQIRPDIVVTIDSPDFCFRVQKKVRARMGASAPKLVHYVAPTVWAWREGRAKKIAAFLDGLICLFDFEPPYFEKESLKAIAAGHPVVETSAGKGNRAAFRARHRIPEDARAVGVFFGSRRGELKRHGEIFRSVMGTLPGGTHFVVPTLPHLRAAVTDILDGLDAPIIITDDLSEKWDAFAACDVAMAVSGTVGLELAAANIPHLIAYRMNPMTYEMGRHFVKVKQAHLLNIMLGDTIVPEYIQKDCTVANVSAGMYALLTDDAVRTRELNAFDIFRQRLGAGEEKTPSQKAAAFIRSFGV